MKNLDEIANKVFKDIDENTIVVYYCADLNDVAPFMCSPLSEGWFYSKNINDLVNYVFEIILANYIINDVIAYGDCECEDNLDFLQSIDVYKKYYHDNNGRIEAIEKLKNLYNENININLSYFEFVKLLVDIENITPKTGIETVFVSFSTPLEARHSTDLHIDNFDFDNLKNNFEI